MKRTSLIIAVFLIVSVLLIGLGYAALSNITLEIKGSAQANPDDKNFSVAFSGTPTVSGDGTTTASITNGTNATINVSGLTAKGETATATYTIQNTSEDLTAKLSAITSNTNTEYFDVTYSFESTSLKKGAATTVTVTIELVKTPIQDTVSSTVGLQITAAPVQPE